MAIPITVHPHIRGAYSPTFAVVLSTCGSSPPTWGIRLRSHTHRFGSAVHPHLRGAYIFFMVVAVIIAVHPHLRGAYTFSICPMEIEAGSSPPTWGILCVSGTAIPSARFIPTYVGHTYYCDTDSMVCSVHPHLRGAYIVLFVTCTIYSGSSPPTWGIRCTRNSPQCTHRFIPTYVGHTPPLLPLPPPPPVHPHLRGAYTGPP